MLSDFVSISQLSHPIIFHFVSSKLYNLESVTPWCRVLLEKLTGLQLVKKFPAFHGTRRFITALTSVRHLSLSWASPIQSTYLNPTSWRSILILSTHLGRGLPSGLFPSGFPTKTLYTPLSSPIRITTECKLTGGGEQKLWFVLKILEILILKWMTTHKASTKIQVPS